MSEKANRYPAIDAVKAIAIIGVLIAHFDGRSAAVDLLPGLQFAFGWCVTVFFGLSGYLEAAKPIPGASWLPYAKTKALRLLVPFVVLHLIYNVLLVFLVLGGMVNDERLRQQGTFELLFTGHSPQLYFLPWLWLIGLALWWPLRTEPRLVASVLAFVAGLTAILLQPSNFGYGAHLVNVPLYVAAFAIGFASRAVGAKAAVLVCVVAAVIESLIYGSYLSLHPAMAIMLLTVFTPVAGSVPWVALIGRYAFAIYLWHVPILMPAVNRLCEQIIRASWVQLPLILVATALICCAWGALLGRYSSFRKFAF